MVGVQRRGRDSNPRYGLSRIQHFQCCSFGHSDTSPMPCLDDRQGSLLQAWRGFHGTFVMVELARGRGVCMKRQWIGAGYFEPELSACAMTKRTTRREG